MKSFQRLLQTPAVMLHSLSSNLQELTADVTPWLGAVAAHQEFAHAVIEGQSISHAFASTGGLLHAGLAASFLPAAAVINSAFECGLGISKIALALLYSESETRRHQRSSPRELMIRGAMEMLGSMLSGSLGVYALASVSVPIACASFAVSSYIKAVTKAWDCIGVEKPNDINDSIVPALLSVVDGTGWLLLGLGIPAGGVLLAASFLTNRYLSTGTLTRNIKEDAGRLGTWCSTFRAQSEEASPVTPNTMPSFRPIR